MKHYKALTETNLLYGRTLCGLDEDSEVIMQIDQVDCDQCKAVYKDIEEGLYIDLGRRNSSEEIFPDITVKLGNIGTDQYGL